MKQKLLFLFSFIAASTISAFAQNPSHPVIGRPVPTSAPLNASRTAILNPDESVQRYSANDDPHFQAIPFDSSNLPIVYISTNWQLIPDEPKITCDMHIIDHGYNQMNHVADSTNWTYSGKIGIERRGSISQLWPQKSYSVETRDSAGNSLDAPILGMPSDNDWVLYGPYDDVSMMRNVMTYELARQMGYWAPRTKYVEVVINSFGWPVYQGLYIMMEKIKRDHNRVDIAKLDSTDNSGDQLTGGYIWAIDRNIWAGDSGFVSSNPQNLFFAYKYPDYAHLTAPQMNYLQAYTDSFENALAAPNFDDLNNGFRKYMDDHSFMDFFYFQEMSKNIDAYKRSAYLYKDKYSNGGKVHAGPVWDFNSAWYNIHWCGFDSIQGWAYQMTCWISSAPVPFWYDRMLQDSIYARDLHCRWIDWRSTVLDTANVFHILDSIRTHIAPAAARHCQNYNITQTMSGQVDTLKAWYFWRTLWMDINMPGNCWNLGVHELTANDPFEVYPNPSAGQFNVHFDFDNAQKISVDVYDTYGRKILSRSPEEFSSGSKIIQVDLSDQADGVYLINITTENGSVSKRVLKFN